MNKSILAALAILMLAISASAYVPEQYRTGEQMSEYEIVKAAMTAHDAGDNSKWVKDTLEDAVIHHTNSGRSLINFYQLRVWLAKIEAQQEKSLAPLKGEPENLAPHENDGMGWCRGYDERCRGVK